MNHNFFIHLSVDGHLGCFHVLAVVHSAVMNIGVHVSFSIMFFSGYMPSNGIVWSYGSFSLSFLKGISILFSIVAVSICIPTNSARGFPFSTPSPALIVCRFFDDGHSGWCEVISHYNFDLHFSGNEQC